MSRRCSRPTRSASISPGGAAVDCRLALHAPHGGHDRRDLPPDVRRAGPARRRRRCRIAASTAPHSSWPSTTMSGTPSTATAYSRLPTTESEMTWPALRTTNRSPSPLSKMISAERRESEQPNRAARGRLAEREFGAALDVLAGMPRLAGDEARVAALHLLPRLERGGSGHGSLARLLAELRGSGRRPRRRPARASRRRSIRRPGRCRRRPAC